MVHLPFLLLILLSSLPRHHQVIFQQPSSSFSFPRFSSPDPHLSLYGSAEVSGSAVKLTATPSSTFSTLSYTDPIDFGRRPSFSTYLSFSISPGDGNGFAFFITPTNADREALARVPFGVSPGVFAVEFDTRMDSELRDPNANHVGLDVGSPVSLVTGNASAVGVKLNSGGKIRSWINFDGDTKILEVRLGNDGGKARTLDALVSFTVDLSGVIWREAMYVGICTYGGGNDSQVVSVYSWSFEMRHAGAYLMHSEPLDPGPLVGAREEVVDTGRRRYRLPNFAVVMAIGAACGAVLALLIVSLWSFEMERHPVAPFEDGVGSGEFECGVAVVVGEKGKDSERK